MGCGDSKLNKIQPANGMGTSALEVADAKSQDLPESRGGPPTPTTSTLDHSATNMATTTAVIDGHIQDDSGLFYMDAQANSSNLVAAVKRGDIENVKRLLQSPNCDVNTLGMWSSTPLITACQYGFAEIASLLLEYNGVDVNHVNERGASALLFACLENEVDIVNQLLSRGAQIATEPATGIYNSVLDRNIVGTPLSVACINGWEKVIAALVHVGADIHVPFNFGILPVASNNSSTTVGPGNNGDYLRMTPLSVTCAFGRAKGVQMLLSVETAPGTATCASILLPDNRGNNCLHHMARSNSNSNKTAASDSLNALLAFVSKDGDACNREKRFMLGQLLSASTDLGENILHLGAEYKATDFMKLIFECRSKWYAQSMRSKHDCVDVSVASKSAAASVVEGTRMDVNRDREGVYVAAGHIPSISNVTVRLSEAVSAPALALENAEASPEKETVSPSAAATRLLEEGQVIEANQRSKGVYRRGKIIKVRLVLIEGSESNKKSCSYDVVYDNGDMEMKVRSDNIRLPLPYTAPRSVGTSVEPLVENSLPVLDELWINQWNNAGQTPLHLAVRKRSLDIVTLLVNNGASPHRNGRTEDGQTPLSLARQICNNKRDKDIIIVLESVIEPISTHNTLPISTRKEDGHVSYPTGTLTSEADSMHLGHASAASVADQFNLTVSSTSGDYNSTVVMPSFPKRPAELPPLSATVGGRTAGRRLVAATGIAESSESKTQDEDVDKSSEIRSGLPLLKTAVTPVGLSQTQFGSSPKNTSEILSVTPKKASSSLMVTPSAIETLFDATPLVPVHQ
jgi:ankyrin repeat protein